MKKGSERHRTKITNDLMHYIYEHIDTPINLDTLSADFGVSKFHMHRLFKREFGRNIHETIQSIRLQMAANLLITNKKSTISKIAAMTGYSSQTSFIRAFGKKFAMTPKAWRNGGFMAYSDTIVREMPDDLTSDVTYENLSPVIKKMPSFKVYYIRHRGYDDAIKQCWQKLQAFTLGSDIRNYAQIALYHDNPIITPLDECHYVACIVLNEPFNAEKVPLPSFEIHGGVYAEFTARGYRNDILKLIRWVYHEWLPSSGYETTAKHAYLIYDDNDFLNETGFFSLKYYIPIVLP
ncbi:AraC family transcriptional regulator [Sulfurimonas sp. HSL-1656]|uniref:AraC family transcriptional regulator n=1 Tax=Thiomicrolovo subterrani TaxID=3131934 RepID=UPI0031F8990D